MMKNVFTLNALTISSLAVGARSGCMTDYWKGERSDQVLMQTSCHGLVDDARVFSSDPRPEVSPEQLKALVLLWILKNRGSDAEDVAEEFSMSCWEASEVVEELLAEGLLEFAD